MDKSSIDRFMFSQRYLEEIGGKANEASHVVTDFGPFVRQEGRKPLASSGREAMQRNIRSSSNKAPTYANHSEFDLTLALTPGFSASRRISPRMRAITR